MMESPLQDSKNDLYGIIQTEKGSRIGLWVVEMPDTQKNTTGRTSSY